MLCSTMVGLAALWGALLVHMPPGGLPIDPGTAVILVALCLGCAVSSHVTLALSVSVYRMVSPHSCIPYGLLRALPMALTGLAALNLAGVLPLSA